MSLIRYKCGMIRLTDEQWERIRRHFSHIPDGRPGRKPIPTRDVLEVALWILTSGAQWHMLHAKLSELQDCASTLSDLVLQRDFASGLDGHCQQALRQRRAG
jgi:hypothetical protein